MAETKTIKIRQARQGDAVALFRLLQQALSESDVAYPAVDDNRLMHWVVETIAAAETTVADLSGRVVGSVALTPTQFPWSADWTLMSRWLYVMPNFRKEGTGTQLIKTAMASADSKGAPLALVSLGGGGEQWKEEMFGSLNGFEYGGGTFFRGVQHA